MYNPTINLLLENGRPFTQTMNVVYHTQCHRQSRLQVKSFSTISTYCSCSLQVFALGTQRYEFVDYEQKTTIALNHIMFKGWDPSWETMPYPATTGEYALYQTQEFYDHLNYAMTNVSANIHINRNIDIGWTDIASCCVMLKCNDTLYSKLCAETDEKELLYHMPKGDRWQAFTITLDCWKNGSRDFSLLFIKCILILGW